MLLMLVLVTPAAADTKDDLARARQRLADAQIAADAAAGRYEQALAKRAQLEDELTRTQQRIEENTLREAALEKIVQQIALRAYTGGGEPPVDTLIFAGNDVLDLGRSARLLDRANAPNLDAMDKLASLRDQLERDRQRVSDAKKESDHVVATLDAEARRVQQELRTADQVRRELEARYTQEQQAKVLAAAREAAIAAQQAAARQAAAQQEAARQQAARQQAAQQQAAVQRAAAAPPAGRSAAPPSRPSPPRTTPPPSSGNIVCPVRGAVSFVDSWGAPRSGGRSHQGVDMMAAAGTPNVAVVSGTITEKYGSLQGNGVTLYGDDGNSYYYFHLSRYEGGPRRVAQGEVIGYTGDTGNAKGGPTHTHFEYHPGGGAAVDPYPLVRAAC
jgi:murein DD-endopeptidase MepM/ murein hydrolase activator NlpD